MTWDTLKESMLNELTELIDHRGDEDHRESLHRLAKVFYSRFAAEDMRGRSVENLFGCLYGLLHFMDRHREMPFCTASVRGELNRRGVRVHTIASCNPVSTRDDKGNLGAILGAGDHGDDKEIHRESLIYFEIGRQSEAESLEELRTTLTDILREVGLVVSDFDAMRERLRHCADLVGASDCVDVEFRDEAVEFLQWLDRYHMTFLGYEYLEVSRSEREIQIEVDDNASLGLLPQHSTSSVRDLTSELQSLSQEELHSKQLSFSKSRIRSRVHRLAYPDYVEVKVFGQNGEVVGQHRFMGLYTFNVYSISPSLIPILRRKVERVMAMAQLNDREHDGRELHRVLELFPRDELFQSSTREIHDTVTAVNRIQERPQTRLFVRRDIHGKFFNCLVYIPRDSYNTELRIVIQDILGRAFGAEESEFTTQFSESILVRCHFVLRVNPAAELDYDINEIEEQIVQATLSWEDRLRIRLIEEFGEEGGENIVRQLGQGFPPGYRDDFDPRVAVLDIGKLQRLMEGEEVAMSLYRLLQEGDDMLRLRLYHRGDSLPLSDILPILENLGLRVVTERPSGVRASDGELYWVQEFSLI
jgi:glutamate dehydrogenase